MTTPLPLAAPLAMSTALPTSSRLPPGSQPETPALPPRDNDDSGPLPLLNLHLHDLRHPGTTRATAFFNNHPPTTFLQTAITSVCTHLYPISPTSTSSTSSCASPPRISKLDLHVRPLPGVAYTTGNHHEKEIHLSSDYIASLPAERVQAEITGVIRHEMVHVFQYNGHGSAPGGLIEGIADWVRMKDELGPPHWVRGGGSWDDGYQNTAYFLTWVEEKVKAADGHVVRLNQTLEKEKWHPGLWKELTGVEVEDLWAMYCAEFGIEDGAMKDPPPPSSPKKKEQRREEVEEDDLVVINPNHGDGKGPPRNKTPGTTIATASTGEDSIWNFAESAFSEVCRRRLSSMVFTGRTNGHRFIKEFESLVEKALPNAGSEEKRLLLVCCCIHDIAWIA